MTFSDSSSGVRTNIGTFIILKVIHEIDVFHCGLNMTDSHVTMVQRMIGSKAGTGGKLVLVFASRSICLRVGFFSHLF